MTHNRNRINLIFVTLLALVLLAACGGSPEPEAPAPAADVPAPAVEPAQAGRVNFQVVSAESTATYIVQEEFMAGALAKLGINAGNSEVHGVSQAVSGFIQLDVANPANALGVNQFNVDMTVLQTDQSRRDNWIQTDGPRFGSFPVAQFVATSIVGAPESYTDGQEVSFQLVGDLTVREISQPVTFDVTATLSGGTLSGTATAALKMSDFGIDPPNFANTLTVQDDFQVRLDLVATQN